MKLRFGKWDALAVAAVVLLAALVLVLFLPGGQGSYGEIYQNGTCIKRVSLSEDQEFTLTGSYTATITVRQGKIAVTASDCPGGDCVRSGWVGSAGRSIVCLPGALEIRVVEADPDVDFVVG
jgi:hypothetical protein